MQKNVQAIDLIYSDCEQVVCDRVDDLEGLKNKTIYIAGGTGFVGTWVATLIKYLNLHHDFNIQLYLLARHPSILCQTAPHLTTDENITMIENDVRRVFELPSETNYVLHAACNPDSRIHALDPMESTSIICDGTEKLLTAAERCSFLENFLYLSSASVYGKQPDEKADMDEEFLGSSVNTNTVLSAYAESKRFAEMLCTIFRSQYRLPVVIARPFSFVGPFQALDKPWAINNFINDVLQGEPIKIYGDENIVRTYLYGSDVAFSLLKMLVKGKASDIYNLGSNEAIDIDSLAKLVASIDSNKSEIISSNIPMLSSSSSKLVPSTTLGKKQLNINVTVELKEAVAKTIQWNKLCQS